MTYNTRSELDTLEKDIEELREKTEEKIEEQQKAIDINNRRRVAALKHLKSE